MKIRYIGTFSNRSVYGAVMNTGDVQEVTGEQGAHLLRNAAEFELVKDTAGKATPAPKSPKPAPQAKPKTKRIGASKGKKK